LAPGARLGPYEVVSLIGSGGMGEVYRARDSRLNREVAIKVLPSEVAADHDRLARFEREAQVLASLNHPNIANIYGVDDSSGTPALVMELVEGPTLADRIAKGTIPLDEALPIAKQIAEALEAAHEQGIIRRDLKPANIKVRPDGTVKVLDCRLAKAFDPVATGVGNATMSPTLSMHATQAGLILGTAAYMSPEQARGRPVDRRADIWAFGCVLFEMLSGTRVFDAEDVSATLAYVITKEPDWNALPTDTPISMRRLLSRCLQKDPKRRLQASGEVRVQIEDVLSGAPEPQTPRQPAVQPRWRRTVPWAAAELSPTNILHFPAGVPVVQVARGCDWAANMIPDRLCASTRATFGPAFLLAAFPDGRGPRSQWLEDGQLSGIRRPRRLRGTSAAGRR
jgi:serine/threonine-protein kinase